jgi:hypothetical protein
VVDEVDEVEQLEKERVRGFAWCGDGGVLGVVVGADCMAEVVVVVVSDVDILYDIVCVRRNVCVFENGSSWVYIRNEYLPERCLRSQ